MAATKEDEERRYVETFRDVWRGDTTMTSLRRGPDPPDFVATLSDGRPVAIELTRVIDEKLAKMSATLHRYLEREFEQVASERNVKGVFAVHFEEDDSAAVATSKKRRVLIDKLIALSRDVTCVDRDLYRGDLEQRGVFGIDNAKICNDDGPASIVIGQSALTRGLSAILRRVQTKDADVSRCRAQAPESELWLLVVATEAFAGWVATDEVRRAEKICTGFDRVFFMDAHTSKAVAWELPVATPEPSVDASM